MKRSKVLTIIAKLVFTVVYGKRMSRRSTILRRGCSADAPTAMIRYYRRTGPVETEDRSAVNRRPCIEGTRRELKLSRAAEAVAVIVIQAFVEMPAMLFIRIVPGWLLPDRDRSDAAN